MLVIVRHGRTAANAAGELLGRRDPALDEVGRVQAAAIARSIGPVDRVVSSPLRRCTETASTISDDVQLDDRLIELDYGDLEGVAVADVPMSSWKQWRADPSWIPAGGESLSELSARVSAAFDDLVAEIFRGGDLTVVVVTHVSPIKAAVGWALNVGPEISWRCRVDQASIHRIGTSRGTPSLLSFNETHHLIEQDSAVG